MSEITKEVIKCFKCEKPITTSMRGISPWEGPGGAVHFEGGWNFGSALYDAAMDGIHVEVVICDGCLKEAKKEPDRMREMKKTTGRTTSERVL